MSGKRSTTPNEHGGQRRLRAHTRMRHQALCLSPSRHFFFDALVELFHPGVELGEQAPQVFSLPPHPFS